MIFMMLVRQWKKVHSAVKMVQLNHRGIWVISAKSFQNRSKLLHFDERLEIHLILLSLLNSEMKTATRIVKKNRVDFDVMLTPTENHITSGDP